MKRTIHLAVVVCFLSLVVAAAAQSNELAITAGGQFPRNNVFDSGASFAVGGSFAHRIIHLPLASLYWEVPVVVAPKSVLRTPGRDNYSSFFFTPGLKLKLAPEFPVSPYFVAGGGLARYKLDTTDEALNTGVFDFGGGIDMKVLPYFSIRGEVRDFYTGSFTFTPIGDTGRQHNIVAQTGLVFRF